MSDGGLSVPLLGFHSPAPDRLCVDSFPERDVLMVLLTADTWVVTQGQGVLDQPVVHVSGTLQFQSLWPRCVPKARRFMTLLSRGL